MKLLVALFCLAASAGPSNEIVARAAACTFGPRAGVQARVEQHGKTTVIANWIQPLDVPYWTVDVPRIGRYAVELVYAAKPASAGVRFTVTLQGYSMGMTKGVVQATKDEKLETFRIGDMELEPGRHRLFVQPENKAGQPAMMLERVQLHWIGN
ncbi:hypothetical protein [Paludibaculum fermentans]|uniref:CBM6 domain-containing protein n=1 Tax=Paludibaculum fermentans TaxID=1473598 RepID=A0A7S7SKP4_PALFE|nr:hypothetical protein [Paludibaculum fermentans]QOY88554.1 hypothetical protein IRI77_00910 [Paludibaculum fermentans]